MSLIQDEVYGVAWRGLKDALHTMAASKPGEHEFTAAAASGQAYTAVLVALCPERTEDQILLSAGRSLSDAEKVRLHTMLRQSV